MSIDIQHCLFKPPNKPIYKLKFPLSHHMSVFNFHFLPSWQWKKREYQFAFLGSSNQSTNTRLLLALHWNPIDSLSMSVSGNFPIPLPGSYLTKKSAGGDLLCFVPLLRWLLHNDNNEKGNSNGRAVLNTTQLRFIRFRGIGSSVIATQTTRVPYTGTKLVYPSSRNECTSRQQGDPKFRPMFVPVASTRRSGKLSSFEC